MKTAMGDAFDDAIRDHLTDIGLRRNAVILACVVGGMSLLAAVDFSNQAYQRALLLLVSAFFALPALTLSLQGASFRFADALVLLALTAGVAIVVLSHGGIWNPVSTLVLTVYFTLSFVLCWQLRWQWVSAVAFASLGGLVALEYSVGLDSLGLAQALTQSAVPSGEHTTIVVLLLVQLAIGTFGVRAVSTKDSALARLRSANETLLSLAVSRAGELHEGVEQLRIATERGRIGIYHYDPATQIYQVNSVFRDLLNLPEATYPEVKAEHVAAVIAPEERSKYLNVLARRTDFTEELTRDHRVCCADGSERYVRFRSQLTMAGSGATRVDGAVVDVTEMVVASRQVAEGKARQARMFSIVAHELRAPAASMDLLLQSKVLTSERLSDSRSVQSVEQIRQTSSQLLNVIDDMRLALNPDLAVDIRPVPFKVRSLTEDIEQSVAALYRHHGCHLKVEAPVFLRDQYVGDVYRLRSVVNQILRNACLRDGGEQVELAVRLESVSDQASRLVVAIDYLRGGHKPNGKCGLSESQLRRIGPACPDAIAESLVPNASAGEVINFSVLQRWVAAMGGALECIDIGTDAIHVELALVLPRHRPQESDDQQRQRRVKALNSVLSGISVLLVEDDRSMRHALAQQLKARYDVNLCTAADGQEALSMLAVHDVDLVITDYFMPGMDGVSFIRALRKRQHSTPVIALTSATLGDDYEALTSAGADVVLGKPLDERLLESVLMSLVADARIEPRHAALPSTETP